MSKISELSDGGSLLPTDFLIAVRSGGNVKVQADQTEFDRIRLGDGEKIELGNNQDLQIYHDGSNSYISDQGTGNLVLQGSNSLVLEATDGTNYIAADDGGSVFIYHPDATNQVKLSTTSSGISITGTATMDGLVVSNASGATLNVNTAGAGVDAKILLHETATATSEYGASLKYSGLNNRFEIGTGQDPETTRLSIARDTGDVSLYEDTGVTPKLVWDSSAESLAFGSNLSITSNEIDVSSGDLTLDVAGNIVLNSDSGGVYFNDGATEIGLLANTGNNFVLMSRLEDKDIIFKGKDGSSTITALTLDMSAAGAATFSSHIKLNDDKQITWGDGTVSIQGNAANETLSLGVNNVGALIAYASGIVINEGGSDRDFRVESDTNPYALFVEGSSSYVKINTSGVPGATHAGFLFTTDQLYTSAGSSTTNNYQVRFYNGNGLVGAITTDGSATAYLTSSDYRLKENVVAMSGATERLKQLKPSRFNFIADADKTVDGFLAHEVQDIVPEAITGAKDAMMDEEYEVTPAVLDDDGNVVDEAVMATRSVPNYQGIDQSKLVPLLVATIQELEARIVALES